MNYLAFKDRLCADFLRYIPDEYNVKSVEIRKVKKINQNLEGLSLVFNDGTGHISPVIYLNQIYDDYIKTKNYEEVIFRAVSTMLHALDESLCHVEKVSKNAFDSEFMKSNVIIQLINNELNRELLENTPHVAIHDLALVCRVVLCDDESGISGFLVDNALLEYIGLGEEELFQLAQKNTMEKYPPILRKIEDVLNSIQGASMINSAPDKETAPVDTTRKVSSEHINPACFSGCEMWILGNSIGCFGASYMLCSEILDQLASSLDSDLYLLPSSIHEIIAVPIYLSDAKHLSDSVHSINANEVALEEKLSDSVYLYTRANKQLTIAVPA